MSDQNKKRSLASQILCPLVSLAVFLFLLALLPRDTAPALQDEPTGVKVFVWIYTASTFVIPIVVYKMLRGIIP